MEEAFVIFGMLRTLFCRKPRSKFCCQQGSIYHFVFSGSRVDIQPFKADFSRSSIEMKDPACRPAIASTLNNMEEYDTVFVGFPIWWYEAPRIIQTFLESYDWKEKCILPFATSGGSGMGKTVSILKNSCPHGEIMEGR